MVSIHSFTVQPRSRFDIESITLNYLQRYIPSHVQRPGRLDIDFLIDVCLSRSHGYTLEGEEALDRDVEAETDIIERKVRFTNEGWQQVLNDVPRSRFTAAHEAYHVIDHAQQITSALLSGNIHLVAARGPTYCDAEWQANHGAGAFLMPLETLRPFVKGFVARGALPFDINAEVARTYGVSITAAETRISKMRP
jgi:hypothetical protein